MRFHKIHEIEFADIGSKNHDFFRLDLSCVNEEKCRENKMWWNVVDGQQKEEEKFGRLGSLLVTVQVKDFLPGMVRTMPRIC